MKVLMMVPLWKRPEILRMFIWKMEQTLPSYAELIPYFILSPEDPEYKNLKEIIEGYEVFEYKNNPLGEKKNKALRNAMIMDWDYYMDMGSDNVWTDLMWDMYKDKFDTGTQYFGMLNIYSIDLQKCKAVFSHKYHKANDNQPTAVGVGRCIRRDVVQDCLPLWDDTWTRGMDGISHHYITQNGYKCDVIDNKKEPVLLDIKTLTNLNPFIRIERESHPADIKQVYEWFGLNQVSIYNYTHTGAVTFEEFRDQVLSRVNIYGSQKEAFDNLNSTYEVEFGEKRYANINSYKVMQTRKIKK